MTTEEEIIQAVMNRPTPRSDKVWLVKQILLRTIGLLLITTGIITALGSPRYSSPVAWIVGWIDFPVLFTGVVLAFGRYEKTSKSSFKVGVAGSEVASYEEKDGPCCEGGDKCDGSCCDHDGPCEHNRDQIISQKQDEIESRD